MRFLSVVPLFVHSCIRYSNCELLFVDIAQVFFDISLLRYSLLRFHYFHLIRLVFNKQKERRLSVDLQFTPLIILLFTALKTEVCPVILYI